MNGGLLEDGLFICFDFDFYCFYVVLWRGKEVLNCLFAVDVPNYLTWFYYEIGTGRPSSVTSFALKPAEEREDLSLWIEFAPS